MNKEYYVYEWIRLDTNEPFYVGKGKGNRWRTFHHRNNYFTYIVNKVPIVVNILHEGLDEETAFGLECYYIWLYRDIIGYEMCNFNDGGEGCALIGKNHPFYGKNPRDFMTEDTRKEQSRKISLANKGKNPWGNLSVEEEERRKKIISESRENYKGKFHPYAKAIICLTTKKVFYFAKDALKFYNLKSAGELSSCCKGYRKKNGSVIKVGFYGKLSDGTKLRWMFLKDFLEKCEYILL